MSYDWSATALDTFTTPLPWGRVVYNTGDFRTPSPIGTESPATFRWPRHLSNLVEHANYLCREWLDVTVATPCQVHEVPDFEGIGTGSTGAQPHLRQAPSLYCKLYNSTSDEVFDFPYVYNSTLGTWQQNETNEAKLGTLADVVDWLRARFDMDAWTWNFAPLHARDYGSLGSHPSTWTWRTRLLCEGLREIWEAMPRPEAGEIDVPFYADDPRMIEMQAHHVTCWAQGYQAGARCQFVHWWSRWPSEWPFISPPPNNAEGTAIDAFKTVTDPTSAHQRFYTGAAAFYLRYYPFAFSDHWLRKDYTDWLLATCDTWIGVYPYHFRHFQLDKYCHRGAVPNRYLWTPFSFRPGWQQARGCFAVKVATAHFNDYPLATYNYYVQLAAAPWLATYWSTNTETSSYTTFFTGIAEGTYSHYIASSGIKNLPQVHGLYVTGWQNLTGTQLCAVSLAETIAIASWYSNIGISSVPVRLNAISGFASTGKALFILDGGIPTGGLPTYISDVVTPEHTRTITAKKAEWPGHSGRVDHWRDYGGEYHQAGQFSRFMAEEIHSKWIWGNWYFYNTNGNMATVSWEGLVTSGTL